MAMISNDVRTTLFPKDKASALVNELNTTEDACGWTYKTVQNDAGHWIVQIFDEDNAFVGTL